MTAPKHLWSAPAQWQDDPKLVAALRKVRLSPEQVEIAKERGRERSKPFRRERQ